MGSRRFWICTQNAVLCPSLSQLHLCFRKCIVSVGNMRKKGHPMPFYNVFLYCDFMLLMMMTTPFGWCPLMMGYKTNIPNVAQFLVFFIYLNNAVGFIPLVCFWQISLPCKLSLQEISWQEEGCILFPLGRLWRLSKLPPCQGYH